IYNDKIVFLNKVETTYFLALVNSDGTSLEVTDLSNTNVGTYPQYYSDGNFILTVGNSTFNKIQTSTAFVSSEVTHTLSSLSPKIWINPKLSPNGQKVVGGYSLENGIWIIDIDGSNLTELK
ncbi:MAG: hypothetical protein KJ811_02295, partial [Candidatus Margulisbacteria bacterium]|nr:hypothetical protein [Candidatus Margulisiibacteriota bacterium]